MLLLFLLFIATDAFGDRAVCIFSVAASVMASIVVLPADVAFAVCYCYYY